MITESYPCNKCSRHTLEPHRIGGGVTMEIRTTKNMYTIILCNKCAKQVMINAGIPADKIR